jgi:cytochrome P450
LRDPVTGELALGDQVVVLDTYDAVRSAMRDPSSFPQWDGCFRSAGGGLIFPGDDAGDQALVPIPSLSRLTPVTDRGPFCHAQTPLFLDPPAHTRFRRLLVEDWAVDSAARALRPQVRRLVSEAIAQASRQPSFDFMRSVAARVSPATLALFFGDDPGPWTEFTLKHPAVWGSPDADGDETDVLEPFQRHLWDVMSHRVQAPGADAISRMVQHSLAGDGLTFGEIQTLVVQMAVIANESTMRLLGSVAAVLARRPALRARLRQDKAAVPRLVEEVLRSSPPVRGVFRRTVRACSAAGLTVPAEQGLFVDLKRAGQSTGALEDTEPAGIGLERRSDRRNLAFGMGIHRCAGASLAVMQAAVTAEVLCQLPSMRIPAGGLAEVARDSVEGPSWLLLELA